jgi:hypothetical protein
VVRRGTRGEKGGLKQRLVEIAYWDLTVHFLLTGLPQKLPELVQSLTRRSWFCAPNGKIQAEHKDGGGVGQPY